MGEVLLPDQGWLGTGEVLTMSSGTSTAQSSLEVQGTMDAVTKSLAKSIANGIASGYSLFGSVTEALATVYRELPAAVHSKENVLYLAARALRGLKTGSAFVAHGALANKINVPLAKSPKVSREAVNTLRQKAFETSPASVPLQKAKVLMERREHAVAEPVRPDAHEEAEYDDLGEPVSFREPAPGRRKRQRSDR